MNQDQQPRPWWKGNQLAWALWALAVLTLTGLVIITILGYWLRWTWTGLGTKSAWDWLELLIIPVVLGGGALWFNRQERRAQNDMETRRQRSEQALAEDRAREEALQRYLDRMQELILDKGLRRSEKDAEIRDVARARTLAVLRSLDGNRRGQVAKFLHEADLIRVKEVREESGEGQVIEAIIDLGDANLRGANLSLANLRGANLGANPSDANLSLADLRGAVLGAYLSSTDLRGADLRGVRGADLRGALVDAYLSGTNLRDAYVRGAFMDDADLSLANLRDAILGAYLSDTHLSDTNLKGAILRANLNGADLSGADLSLANLRDAYLSLANLSAANLSGAYLSDAYLSLANLRDADLRGTNLSGAYLSLANLRDADLSFANLSGAYLSSTNLRNAYLSGADLRDAKGWTNEQLAQAASLVGTTLPDGTVMTEEAWEEFKKRYG
jgi:uncharacterized protein YjbI with pentapeptide repeats